MVLHWHPDKCGGCEYVKQCHETGKCPVNQRLERPYWTNDFIVAVEVYRIATQLSGVDFNGYPQLTLIDFVIQMNDFAVENKSDFLEYVAALHSWHCKVISEKKA